MKIRNAFVSNSSTSSFILGWKGELTIDLILNCFGTSTSNPLYNLAKELAEYIYGLEPDNEDEENDYITEMCKKLESRGMEYISGLVFVDEDVIGQIVNYQYIDNIDTENLYLEIYR